MLKLLYIHVDISVKNIEMSIIKIFFYIIIHKITDLCKGNMLENTTTSYPI